MQGTARQENGGSPQRICDLWQYVETPALMFSMFACWLPSTRCFVRSGGTRARETQVVLLRRLIRKLHNVAETRRCSINQLVNSGLAAYYSKQRLTKPGLPSRPTQKSAGYDQMSTAERQRLVEALGNLAGRQEGPRSTFPDGSRYEYDPKLKRTVEVASSGKRYPVALVAGRFQRGVADATARKTAR